jgi:hypothetical protein
MGLKDKKNQLLGEDRRREKEAQERMNARVAEEMRNAVHVSPEMYIGTPDMLEPKVRKRLKIVAYTRQIMLNLFYGFLILPMASMLMIGIINLFYDKYILGDIYNYAVVHVYRPNVIYGSFIYLGLIALCWIIIAALYIDRKRMLDTAFEMLKEKGMKPPTLLKRDGQKERFLVNFYHLNVHFNLPKIIMVISAVLLVMEGAAFNGLAKKQVRETTKLRSEFVEDVKDAYTGNTTDKLTYTSKKISFVERYKFHIDDNTTMQIDIDDNGTVLDSATMIRYKTVFDGNDLKNLNSAKIEKKFNQYQKCAQSLKSYFLVPEVTEVKFDFSDYLKAFIDDVHEDAKWKHTTVVKSGNKQFYVIQNLKYDFGNTDEDTTLTINMTLKQKGFDKAAEKKKSEKNNNQAGRYSILNLFN